VPDVVELRRLRRAWPVVAVPAAVALCALWGAMLTRSGAELHLGAAPLVGRWEVRLTPLVLLPLASGALLLAVAPLVAARASWRVLLLATTAGAALWSVSLALTDGISGLTGPLGSGDEYLHEVPQVRSGFLPGFVERINTYGGPGAWTTHVAGHPPGALLVFAGLARIGLGGSGPAAALCVLAGASAAAAVLIAVRAVADEPTARAAAPYLALMPGAVWVAVSADALFLGVTAWGIAALITGRALAGGLLLGAALMLTYGALPLGALALAALLRRRDARGLLVAGAGVLAVLGGFALAGFRWDDGLAETLIRVEAGAGGERPALYFAVANLAAFGLAVGPACVAGLGRLRRADPLWWLVGPTLVALAAADLSGASKGEVERIWLPYAPWLLLAAARLPPGRGWLLAQAATALTVQVVLRSKW